MNRTQIGVPAVRIGFAIASLALLVAIGPGVGGQTPQAPEGDYGDAPDGLFANYGNVDPLREAGFPSAFDDEERAFIVHRFPKERVFLGEDVTLESDGNLIDQDEADDGWVVHSMQTCAPQALELRVQVPQDAPAGPLYLNALFDWDHNGFWQGADAACPAGAPLPANLDPSAREWAIRNLRLDLPPYEIGPGFDEFVLLPEILTGSLPGELWLRWTVTTEPVDESAFPPVSQGGAGWDGRGDFVFGESEDYITCLLTSRETVLPGCPPPGEPGPPAGPAAEASQPGGDGGEEAEQPGDDEGGPASVGGIDPRQQGPGLIDLSLTKSVDDPTPNVGQTVLFTIELGNDGPDPASGVAVSDPLPGGLEFLSSSATRGFYDPDSALWTIGELGVDESVNLQISARVVASGSATNTAQVFLANEPDLDSTPGNDSPEEDDQDSVQLLTPPAADLSLTKAVDEVNPAVGDTVTFTIALGNDGPDPASGVRVRDALPAGLSFVGASPAQGSYSAGSGIWDVGSLGVGESTTLQLSAQVTEGGAILNTAQVSAANEFDPDSTPDNGNPAEDDQDSASVNSASDLSVQKVGPSEPVSVGQNLTWSLTVQNAGPSEAANVILTDPLAAGLTFVGATPSQGSCSLVVTTVTCNLASIPSGGSANVTIEVTVEPTFGQTSLTNAAAVDSDSSDPDPGDNADEETTTILLEADLAISKVDVSDPVVAGQQVSWTLQVDNAGPGTATSAQITDALPAGTSFVSASASQGSCSHAGGTVTCALGNLAEGSSATATVTALVSADFSGGSLSNTASVSSGTPDPQPGDNEDSEDTAVDAEADLSILKTDAPDPVIAGEQLTYTLAVTNNGPSSAQNVSVSDPLPGGLTLASAVGTGWDCTASTATAVSCSRPSLSVTAAPAITVTADVSPSLTSSPISNTATVAADTPDPVPGNNSDSEDTELDTLTDLALTKTVSPTTAVAGQDTVTWSIEVVNNGPSDAQNAEVSDTLPAGVTFVSASAGCSESGGTVTCSLGTLAAGDTANLSVDTSVDADATGTLLNPASVSTTTPETTLANNDDDAQVTVEAEADLTVLKLDSPDPVLAGEQLSYTLQVSNLGPSVAQNVTVTDTLPAEVSGASGTGAGWSCSGTSPLICTRASLAAGAAPDITITATVAPGTAGTITNDVSVSSDTPDPAPGNNDDSEPTEVDPGVDLGITKADSVEPVLAGNQLVYTLSVVNNGPGTADNVSVTDALPAGVSLANATGTGWTCSGASTITCTRSSLGVTTAPDITITVDVDPALADGTTLTNTASVTSDNIDTNAANDNDSEDTLVNTETDLVLTKTASPTTAVAGQDTVTWSIEVVNNGPSDAQSVEVTDTLPAGVTFVSAPGCSESGGTVTCSLGTLAAGDTANLSVDTSVDADATGTLLNPASVSTTTPETTLANNDDDAQVTVETSADLGITKDDSPDPVLAGEDITYTLVVTNNGPSDAQSVTVSDPVPANTTFVSATPDNGGSCDSSVSCALGTIPDGGVVNVTIVVTADSGFAGTVTNTATVSSATPDPNAGNDSDDEDTLVDAGLDLALTKTDVTDPVIAGETVTWTLSVTNNGPADASNVTVTDTLPAEVSGASGTGTGWSCSGASTLTCTLASLAASTTSSDLTITATVDPAFTGTLNNTAAVDSDNVDTNSANDSDSEETTVDPEADLAITKSDSPEPVLAGNDVTYTLAVTNNGPSVATSVTVTDTLPAEVSFVSATGSGWTCSESAGTVTCDATSLAVGAAPPITITAAVPPDTALGTVLNNSATVGSATPDPNAGNDSDTEDTTVDTSADLGVTKQSPSSVKAGDTFIYQIVVQNNGPSDAQNVQITDTLPSEVTLVSASSADGTCSGTTTVTCDFGTVAAGDFVSATLSVEVDSSFTGSSINNTVTASSDTSDPASGNDSTDVDTTVIQETDISLGLNDDPTQVKAGEQLTYRITIDNNGPSNAENVTMDNPFPDDVTLISGPTIIQAPPGSSCTSGGTISCNFGTLPVGDDQAVVEYVVLVNQDFPTNSLSNNASASTTTTDSQPGNNSDSTATTVTKASDMVLVEILDDPDPVSAGGQVTFTATVRNDGPSQSATTTVTFGLPGAFTFASGSGCSASGSDVICELGAVNSGDTAQAIITVDVDPGASGTVFTFVTVDTSSTDGTAGNNSVTISTTIE